MHNSIGWKFALVFAVILLVAAPVCCSAATYYVSTTGSDSNDGSVPDDAHAWATIDHGDMASLVSAGDTVRVQAGTYNASSGVSLVNTSGIIYVADGVVIISGSGAAAAVQISADNTVFNGFQVTGPTSYLV
ncbi:MAG: hypothetical protein M1133_11920, partial [Armatimonadetes bacterium]|nr:hypothetical protein [Armatimonadota bacterium]